ncbi:hypothetical protein DFH08DRAFT_968882 [Mycena albidolilacea]|uniref:Uncharacterized protein n=1 Tax=Mycena albidolilacea TaxID=1033008 RepID=A0AAD6ZJD4_9AGAR|nr:hypothetical protein DFH08DRAFT_968882 [Mycena albidolilacea]
MSHGKHAQTGRLRMRMLVRRLITKRDVICRTPRCSYCLAHRRCDPELWKCRAKSVPFPSSCLVLYYMHDAYLQRLIDTVLFQTNAPISATMRNEGAERTTAKSLFIAGASSSQSEPFVINSGNSGYVVSRTWARGTTDMRYFNHDVQSSTLTFHFI